MIGVRDPQKDTSLRARRTSIGLKDAAKWHEGCTRPAIADTHRASWLRASRHEDRPMGLEACGHAAWWTPASRLKEPRLRESPTPMGPHGHEETTRRMRRSGKGLRPSGRIDSGKRREGAPLRGSRPAMRPHRRADQPGGSIDSRRGLPPWVRFDTVIGGRAVLDRPDARLAPRAGRRGPPSRPPHTLSLPLLTLARSRPTASLQSAFSLNGSGPYR